MPEVKKQRGTHKKSRHGCTNCKSKRRKCDEQGPPCYNCIARKVESTCTYPSGPHSIRQKQQQRQRQDGPIKTLRDATTGLESLPFERRRLLELELMHQWTSSTYRSMCCVPEDPYYFQVLVPRGALQNDFLLHGMLAMSALHLAVSANEQAAAWEGERAADFSSIWPGPMASPDASTAGFPAPCAPNSAAIARQKSASYVRVAMEYYDRASASFRTHLMNNTNQDNLHYLYVFSIMVTVVNLVMPLLLRDHSARTRARGNSLGSDDILDDDGDMDDETASETSIICRISTIFELYLGAYGIVMRHQDWLMESPLGPSYRSVVERLKRPADPLNHDQELAFERLNRVIERRFMRDDHTGSGLCSPGNKPNSLSETLNTPYITRLEGNYYVGWPGAQEPGSFTTDSDSDSSQGYAHMISSSEESIYEPLIACSLPLRAAYRNAVQSLHKCYIVDARPPEDALPGFCTGFIAMTGGAFASAMRRHEPVALFILLHWAVLLHRLRDDPAAWWSLDIGQKLVEELSHALAPERVLKSYMENMAESKDSMLMNSVGAFDDTDGVAGLGMTTARVAEAMSHVVRMPEWRESIDWAKAQVGLVEVVVVPPEGCRDETILARGTEAMSFMDGSY